MSLRSTFGAGAGRPGPEPSALSSDAWYTLIYLAPARRQELHRARRRVWLAPLLRAGLGRPEAVGLLERLDAWKRACESRGRTPTLPEQVAWLAGRAGRPLPDDGIYAELDQVLLRSGVRPAPDAARVLRTLSDRGVRLAVVSNVTNESPTAARTVLDRAGLLPLFETVYLSSEHPWSKPRPEPFCQVAGFLGVSPRSMVHVGDLTYDLRGAHRAGAAAVLFTGYARWNRFLPGAPPASLRRRVPSASRWTEVLAQWPFAPSRGS